MESKIPISLLNLFVYYSILQIAWSCPEECLCTSTLAACSYKELLSIPEKLPAGTKELQLNGNKFGNVTLSKSNFTGLQNLEKLYLTDCGIEQISPDTFSDLKNLKQLDLSKNRIKQIGDYSFRGLRLNYLFLARNKGIKFAPLAFADLRVSGLYLENCNIKTIPMQLFAPLNATLNTLSLHDNQITFISERVVTQLFTNIQSVWLWGNPLHCNCQLKTFFNFATNRRLLADASILKLQDPTCGSPHSVANKTFKDLQASDFACSAPSFHNIEILFDKTDTAFLLCNAKGDPLPNVYWITPYGVKYPYFPVDHKKPYTEAIYRVTRKPGALRETYKCYAESVTGNATMLLNVSWPKKQCDTDAVATKRDSVYVTNRDKLKPTPVDDTDLNVLKAESNDRYYTFTELVTAIVGTFLGTLLLCILTAVLVNIIARAHRKRKSSDKSSSASHLRYFADVDDMRYYEFKPMIDARVGQIIDTHVNSNGTLRHGAGAGYTPETIRSTRSSNRYASSNQPPYHDTMSSRLTGTQLVGTTNLSLPNHNVLITTQST